jgi:hypothetical protein
VLLGMGAGGFIGSLARGKPAMTGISDLFASKREQESIAAAQQQQEVYVKRVEERVSRNAARRQQRDEVIENTSSRS